MNLRPMSSLAYALLIVAAMVSLFFVYLLKPASVTAAALFGIWLVLPYLILALILAFGRRAAIDVANLVVTLLVVVGGLLFLVAVIVIWPDPQGGIAVLLTPIYQGVAMAVLIPLSRRIFGNASHGLRR